MKISISIKGYWKRLKRFVISETRSSIFKSARLKLTGFYLAVIVVLSLVLTLSFRTLAERAFNHAKQAQQGVVNNLFLNLYSVPPQPDYTFKSFQNKQANSVRNRLNDDVIIINIYALIVGGIISYWYAGRTLRPIEEAHETQARFAADASHELRTPLASLKVENEVFLRQKSFSQGEARELINSNLEEVQRLESLASNLLALSQYGTTALNLKALDVRKPLTSAVEHLAQAASAKKIKFKQSIPKASILGQNESLEQLFSTLIDNALKYSPVGSAVYLDGINAGNQYHVSIRDEGPGIANADLPHIFDRLYRGDKSRNDKVPGYGLGLALAQEIASANRARLTARNYPSGGAQFVVSFMLSKS